MEARSYLLLLETAAGSTCVCVELPAPADRSPGAAGDVERFGFGIGGREETRVPFGEAAAALLFGGLVALCACSGD